MSKNNIVLPLILGGVLAVGLFGYAYLRIFDLSKQVARLSRDAAAQSTTTLEMASSIADLQQKTSGISDSLTAGKQNIAAIQSKLGGFEETVGTISGTVTTLEKLSKTDPQLLAKYSKVFFLSEHYIPERLTQIAAEYTYNEKRSEEINSVAAIRLSAMLGSAKVMNIPLFVKSAYRSFDEQASLKNSYTVVYGAGTANQFSADQGYSEHQLGTAVDFISTGQGGELSGFEKTAAYTWLLANAYQYGFILSYPQGNPYYIFEPWHWRFVGVKLATYLHDQHKNFYDLDQREIDTYLVNFAD